jgi:hypothetical protein
MLLRLICVATLLLPAPLLHGQTSLASRYQLFGGYSYLSNSLNGVSGSRQSLNGWDAAFAIPPWHSLRAKFSAFGYNGTNLGAPQHPYFVMGGGQYGKTFGRESAFVEAMAGSGNVNANWAPGGKIGGTASFSAIVGGGLDTPLSRRFAIRVSGDYQYAYFRSRLSFIPHTDEPIYVTGLPTDYFRLSTGLVWRF